MSVNACTDQENAEMHLKSNQPLTNEKYIANILGSLLYFQSQACSTDLCQLMCENTYMIFIYISSMIFTMVADL